MIIFAWSLIVIGCYVCGKITAGAVLSGNPDEIGIALVFDIMMIVIIVMYGFITVMTSTL